jgi:hypothetical protein
LSIFPSLLVRLWLHSFLSMMVFGCMFRYNFGTSDAEAVMTRQGLNMNARSFQHM